MHLIFHSATHLSRCLDWIDLELQNKWQWNSLFSSDLTWSVEQTATSNLSLFSHSTLKCQSMGCQMMEIGDVWDDTFFSKSPSPFRLHFIVQNVYSCSCCKHNIWCPFSINFFFACWFPIFPFVLNMNRQPFRWCAADGHIGRIFIYFPFKLSCFWMWLRFVYGVRYNFIDFDLNGFYRLRIGKRHAVYYWWCCRCRSHRVCYKYSTAI